MNQEPDSHGEMLDMLRRRHEIYCGIVQKDVNLLPGSPPGTTDCESFITVPFEDARADLVHRHEWQHVFFQTDLRARSLFVTQYADRLFLGVDQARRNTLEDSFKRFVHVTANAIDDLRVNSLWSSIYPFSGNEIADRWRDIILSSRRYETDLTFFIMGVGLGLEEQMVSHRWVRWAKLIRDELTNIPMSSYPVVLLVTKNLLDEMVKLPTAIPQAPPLEEPRPVPRSGRLGAVRINRRESPERQAAQASFEDQRMGIVQRMVSDFDRNAQRQSPVMDTPQPPTSFDSNYARTESRVATVMGSSPSELQPLMHTESMQVQRILEKLRSSEQKPISFDERVLKNMESIVEFFDIQPGQILKTEARPEDARATELLKVTFGRLMGRRRRRLQTSGTRLNPTAYIEMLMGGGADIFEEDGFTKGFHGLLLVDMSGSMRGRWKTVSRAVQTLATAMKLPQSKLEVWGFSGDQGGKTTIFRFNDPLKGVNISTKFLKAWGLTPLHIAIEVATKRLALTQGMDRHLFIVTDGMPVHIGMRQGRYSNTNDLCEEIALQVRTARHRRLSITGLLIGDDVKDEAANMMFGDHRSWNRVDDDGDLLYRSLVDLVQRAFVHYLRGM